MESTAKEDHEDCQKCPFYLLANFKEIFGHIYLTWSDPELLKCD